MITPLPFLVWKPGATGIFTGISNSDYHMVESGLSRSIAEKLAFRSPSHAKEATLLLREPTPAMEMGTLVHCGTLEPEKLASSYYVRPETRPAEKDCTAVRQGLAKPGDPIAWDGKAGYCKNWMVSHSDRPTISVGDEKNLLGCIEALKSNPTLSGMLKVGHPELSVFAFRDDVLLKCRPDLIAEDANGECWVLDIKKCQDASFWAFQSESRRFRRDFQEAWYRFVLDLAGIKVHHFVFAGVEEDPPHGVGMYRIDKVNVDAAIPHVHRAIDLWFQGIESGVWPGYPQEIVGIGWKP